MANFKIIIDHRERHENSIDKNIITKFNEMGIEYELQTLPVGDYLIVNKETNDTFCIERKIISDFVGSVLDGRLKHEISKMNEIYAKNFLIVSGKWEDYYKDRSKIKRMGFIKKVNGFTVNQRLGVFASISARTNTKIIQVDNDNQFIQLLLSLGDKLTDGKVYDTPVFTRKKKEETAFVHMLTSFPNVSEDKAEKIISQYKNFATFYDALKKDTFEMQGCGNKTIELFKRVLLDVD